MLKKLSYCFKGFAFCPVGQPDPAQNLEVSLLQGKIQQS